MGVVGEGQGVRGVGDVGESRHNRWVYYSSARRIGGPRQKCVAGEGPGVQGAGVVEKKLLGMGTTISDCTIFDMTTALLASLH